jgi:hypothetical protein
MISSDDIIERTGTAGRPVDPVDVTEDSADLAVPTVRKHRPVDPAVAAAAVGRTESAAFDRAAPPARKKRKRKPRIRPLNPSADAYSIKNFCEQHEISEALYFQMQTDGVGPRIMKVGGAS